MDFATLIPLLIPITALVLSVILHEVAHGYMAEWLGDSTARRAGRLTLNPLPHIDLYGSIIIPGLLLFTNAPILLGWAKPVPYNPHNIANKYGDALVAAAGPAVNFVLAFIFGLALQMGMHGGDADIARVLFTIVLTNTMLGVFNLIPVPPLDGSKVITFFLPRALRRPYDRFLDIMHANPYVGFGFVLFIVLSLGRSFDGFVVHIARMFAGL